MTMKSARPSPGRGCLIASACALALALMASLSSAALAASPTSGSARLGSSPAARQVQLALPLNADVGGLERLAAAVTQPGSPQYGQYESIASLSERFGASAAARSRVVSYLRRSGATGVSVDVTGLWVNATMSVGVANRLFGTSLGDFRSARAGRFMAPRAQTQVPAALRGAVTGVVGLDTKPLFSAPAARAQTSASWPRVAAAPAAASGSAGRDDQSGYADRSGTAAGCAGALAQSGFTPNQYLTAYGYAPLQAAGLGGQGERVALIEIDGFHYNDLRTFSKCFGLATPAINAYGVGLNKPLSAGGEATLDLEVLDAAAPKLKAVDVYESKPNAIQVLRALTAPLANNSRKPDVISASLGACEPATEETIGNSGLRSVEGSLALAAASGISVLASSGDDGSSSCLAPDGSPLPGLAVSYPASSPWVTGVGGTNIELNDSNQIVAQEVWNDSPVVPAAGGGGLSELFRRPGFQKSFVVPNRRAVPDVSMLADVAPGYEIYCTAKGDCVSKQHPSPWSQVGGTSAAAPLVAGGLALVDQDLRLHGRQNIGLANPLLYRIDHSAAGPGVIADVTLNENDLGDSIEGRPFGCCSAGIGFDYASGLGSVNVGALASTALTIVPRVPKVGLTVPAQPHPVASRRLLAGVSCAGRCLLGAYAKIQLGRSRSRMTQSSTLYLLKRAGRRTVTISFDKKTLGKLRSAVAHRERITATLYGAILDPSHNVESETRGKALRISG